MHKDQAYRLKQISGKAGLKRDSRGGKKIAFLSGKGGVGKSVLALNSSILLAEAGVKVLLVDADFLTPSLHILANVNPRKSLESWLIHPGETLENLVVPVIPNLHLISSEGEGYHPQIRDWQYVKLLRRVLLEGEHYDLLIVDFPTGYYPFLTPVYFELDEMILVSSPEPTSVIDTYAMIKLLTAEMDISRLKVLFNMVEDEREGRISVENLNQALTHFLSIQVEALPHIPFHPLVQQSVKHQNPISYENKEIFSTLSHYLAHCLH